MDLSPATLSGGNQSGGLLVVGGRRKGKRSGSKRSGSKRRGSKRSSKRSRRKMRGGNCGAGNVGGFAMPHAAGMSGGNTHMLHSMYGGNIPITPSHGGGRTRRLRKLTGRARRHRTKSYSA